MASLWFVFEKKWSLISSTQRGRSVVGGVRKVTHFQGCFGTKFKFLVDSRDCGFCELLGGPRVLYSVSILPVEPMNIGNSHESSGKLPLLCCEA